MKKTKKSVQIGLGASSILMIFVVLCMMILSVLSYNRATQNQAIADREKVYQEDYYKADMKMETVYEVLKLYDGKDISMDEILTQKNMKTALTGLSYQQQAERLVVEIDINSQQILHGEFKRNHHKIAVTSWKLSSKGGL